MTEQFTEVENNTTPRIGDYLREKREERGYTLKVISQHTRINASLLEKLERNRLDELPSKAYVTGFVKSYAKTLGLDEKDTLSILDLSYENSKFIDHKTKSSTTGKVNLHMKAEPLAPANNEESNKMFAPVAIVGVAVLLVAVAIFSSGDPKKATPKTIEKEVVVEEKVEATVEETNSVVTPKSVTATTPLVEMNTEVIDDEATLEQMAAAEEAKKLAAEKKLADDKRLAEENKLAAEKAAKEKAAQELEAKKLAEEKKAAELKAAKEAEAKKLAEEKKAAEEEAKRLAEEKKEAEAEAKKLAEEKKAAELKAAKEKAAQEKAAAEAAKKEQSKPVAKVEDKKNDIVFESIPMPMFKFQEAKEEELAEWLPDRYKFAIIEGKENVFINAIDGDTWLTYKSDEDPVKKFILKQGRSVLIRGNDLRIFLGNAKVAKIFYNNKLIDPITKSGVKSLVFPTTLVEKIKIPLFIYNPDGTAASSEPLYSAE